MLKLIRKMLFLALCIASFAAATHADESSDFYIAAGTKVWMADWSSWAPGGKIVKSEASKTMVIPSLTLIKGKWLVTAGYLTASGYTLNYNNGNDPSWAGERTEVDVSVGYRFDGVTLALGYKDITQTMTGVNGVIKTTYSGPIVGVSSSTRVNDSVSAYGNFSYGLLQANDGTVLDKSTEYVSSEFGMSAVLGAGFSATLAYKFQLLDVANINPADAAERGQDITKGFIAGLTWVY